MSKLGGLLFGAAVMAGVAAGVYYYLDKQDRKGSAGADETDDEFITDEEEEEDAVDAIRDAADRAYATIKHGTDETISKVREAVGPKGEEIMDVASKAVGDMAGVVTDSAAKVKSILDQKEETAVPAGAEEVFAAVQESSEKTEEISGEAAAEAFEEAAEQTEEFFNDNDAVE